MGRTVVRRSSLVVWSLALMRQVKVYRVKRRGRLNLRLFFLGGAATARTGFVLALANDQRPTTNDGFFQIRHLNRRKRGFESLIAHLQSGTIDRLFEILASEHTECMRHSSFLRRLSNPPRDFVDDYVVMRSIPANQAAQADDGIVFFSFSKGASRGRNFESARDPDNFDVTFFCARTD